VIPRRFLLVLTTCVVALSTVAPARGTVSSGGAAAARRVIVLNGQGNDLDAYASRPPFRHQTVIETRARDPKGLDINAQICFFPDGRTFIAGEDTGQPDPVQGWGIFRLRGQRVGSLSARQIGKLQPTYQGAADNAENYGCGVLSDGRVVTSDIGNQSAGDGNGQLIIWFPPYTLGFEVEKEGTNGAVPYCKIDIGIATAGGIAVDADDNVYVASARPPTSGVWRYSGPFPTSAEASGGCETTDSTGAPLTTSVRKEQFIAVGEHGLVSPNAIVAAPRSGSWYVSSVFTGVINEYDRAGAYVRTVLEPPAGEGPGPEPISTGSPLGLGVAPDGTLYFADIGLVVSDAGVGPGDRTGSVRRIRFVDGAPQPPETMADGLAFPDGIGVFVPPRRR
jgi:hypothetical protein